MAEKTIPWWRKALNFALGGIRSGFGLFSRPAKPEVAPEPKFSQPLPAEPKFSQPLPAEPEEETALTDPFPQPAIAAAPLTPAEPAPDAVALTPTAEAEPVPVPAIPSALPIDLPPAEPEALPEPPAEATLLPAGEAEVSPDPAVAVEEAAEKLGILDEIDGERPSGAKARVDSVGFIRGLKPPPPSGSGFSAALEAVSELLTEPVPVLLHESESEVVNEPLPEPLEAAESAVEAAPEPVFVPANEQAAPVDEPLAASLPEASAAAEPEPAAPTILDQEPALVAVSEPAVEAAPEPAAEMASPTKPEQEPAPIAIENPLSEPEAGSEVEASSGSREEAESERETEQEPQEAEPEPSESEPEPKETEQEPELAAAAIAAPELVIAEPEPAELAFSEPVAEPELAEAAEAVSDPKSKPEPAAAPEAEKEPVSEPVEAAALEAVKEPVEAAGTAVEYAPVPAIEPAVPVTEPLPSAEPLLVAEVLSAIEPPPVAAPLPAAGPELLPSPEQLPAPEPAAEAVAPLVLTIQPTAEEVASGKADEKAAAKLAARQKKLDESSEQSPFSVIVGQVYDGPLDLLLDLIRKQDIDIYDIPIAKITAQFLAYVNQLKSGDVDVAGEFIYTASLLIHIKSKMLLPRAASGPDDAADDPRRELVERLLEHERFKNAAQMLQQKQMLEAATWSNPGVREFKDDAAAEPEIAADTVDLVRIFRDILERARKRPIFNVEEDAVTVGQMIQFLGRRLIMEDKPVALRRLLSHTRSERALIAMFLALLELVRLQAILLRQDLAFSEIFIKKNTGFDAVMNEGLGNARDDWR